MFKPIKWADAKKIYTGDNFASKVLHFNKFIKPHEFKRGKQHCVAFVQSRVGKLNRKVGGFIISTGPIKVFPETITKGIQGGVHLRATVEVLVFKATHSFESTIIRIEDNFAIGEVCGIVTRYDLRSAPYTPRVGQKVKSVMIEYSEKEGISTMTCALEKKK